MDVNSVPEAHASMTAVTAVCDERPRRTSPIEQRPSSWPGDAHLALTREMILVLRKSRIAVAISPACVSSVKWPVS